jgi:bacteriocin biosynthesis cyclodehydratase domain-containing protein
MTPPGSPYPRPDTRRVLAWKPHLRVVVREPAHVFVIAEGGARLLEGRALARVAALLDGRRSISRILEELAGEFHPAVAYEALAALEAGGHVAPADAAREDDACWWALGIPPAAARERLAATAVHAADEDLRRALAEAGLALAPTGVEVIAVAGYLAPELEAVNRRALAEGRTWLPVKLDAAVPWLGPLLQPGGPCWACLAHRLRGNRPVETYLGLPDRAAAGHPSARRAAAAWAAAWLVRAIARGLEREPARLVELGEHGGREHPVARRPQCPACGDPGLYARRAGAPIILEARPATFAAEGGYRTATPEETYARHAALVSPITGVVTSLGPVPGRDHPLRPVYAAGMLVCPRGGGAPAAEDFHATSMGKGRTPAQARASALCEAIERQSAVFQGDEPTLRAPWTAVADEAVHPDRIQGFSEAQLRARAEHNARHRDRRRHVPLPFDPAAAIDWTPAWSLTHGRRRLLPTGLCYLGAPAPPEHAFFQPSSNGHAVGNVLEEAVLQGFLELVERDAVAIWWYGRHRRPAARLDGFGDPLLAARAAHYAELGWETWALDLTHDLGVPVYAAVGRARDRWILGFGAHLDARLALDRAFTELGQLFAPDGEPPFDAAALPDDAFLRPHGEAPAPAAPAPAAPAAPAAPPAAIDLRDAALRCVACAAAAGLETIVLDQTRPDLGLCAVKVVVPGLRHFWPRFAPGRLYDVPVALGWRAAPLAEAELNPVPLYL